MVNMSSQLNTAGHIFDKAKYDAIVSTDNIKGKGGHLVYSDGDNHYIVVSRYRYDVPVTTQYNAFAGATKKSKKRTFKGTSVVKIPENYARYLTGKAQTPKKPEFMHPVSDGVLKKCSTTKPIVRTPLLCEHEFQYTSPGAIGYYTLGVLDWLCVDLPVSCVESTLATTVVMLASLDTTKNGLYTNTSNSSSLAGYGGYNNTYSTSSYDSYSGSYTSRSTGSSAMYNQTTTSDCTRCNGKGYVSGSYGVGPVDCPACTNGKVTSTTRVGRTSNGIKRKQCTLCNGQKRYDGKMCPSCLGKGYQESFWN